MDMFCSDVAMREEPRAKEGDKIGMKGKVEIFAYRRGILFDFQEIHNIILYQGNAEIIRTISTISPSTTPRIINRMCVGDQGTIPADPTVPKVPTKDLPQLISTNGLYHEIYRKDADSRTITLSGSTNECKFIATFNASDVALSAYSNSSQPRVNEVGLVLIDPVAAGGLVRAPVTAPDAPPADEVVLSIRTFKTIPFEIANDVTVTIRYTIYME